MDTLSGTYRNANDALRGLAHRILENGAEVGSRLGERTMERLMVQTTLAFPQERYITLPGRRVNLAAQIAETVWVLSGRDDIGWLSAYLPRAVDFSDDGVTWRGAYGPRLRRWPIVSALGSHGERDQLAHVVDLLRNDRSTRRAVMAIYDPARDTSPGKDIPCNDFIQFISRGGALHGHVFVRSNDLWWGWSGINQFEWSALLEIVAGLVGAQVGTLTFSTTSLHLYDRHWQRARRLENDLVPDSDTGARFNAAAVTPGGVERLDMLLGRWMSIEDAIRENARRGRGIISAHTASRIENFPEPMLREWLWVLAHHWTGHEKYLDNVSSVVRRCALLAPTPAHRKASEGTEPGNTEAINDRQPWQAFHDAVNALHEEKHRAYGDSWRKRGEMLSILPNVARKVDRLGQGETSDETAVDTAVDLMVYLAKYRLWLTAEQGAPTPIRYSGGSEVRAVELLLREVATSVDHQGVVVMPLDRLVMYVKAECDAYLNDASAGSLDRERHEQVDGLLQAAYVLARRMWQGAQK